MIEKIQSLFKEQKNTPINAHVDFVGGASAWNGQFSPILIYKCISS